jgi:hypothetical protein
MRGLKISLKESKKTVKTRNLGIIKKTPKIPKTFPSTNHSPPIAHSLKNQPYP